MTEWTPVIAVVVSAIVGLGIYNMQKIVDRRFELKKLREEAYSRYLKIMFDAIIVGGDQQKKHEHNKEYLGLFAVASDNVLDKTGALWVYLRDTSDPKMEKQRTQDEVNELFIAVFKAMRKDCFEPTKLRDKRIAEIFPLEV